MQGIQKRIIWYLIATIAFSGNFAIGQVITGSVFLKENIKVKNTTFEMGMEEGYTTVDYDDDSWEIRYTPEERIKPETFLISPKSFTGDVWFRKEFMVPENWKGQEIELILGTSEESHLVYVNGDSLGYSGTDVHKRFHISQNIRPGQKNVIATFIPNSSGKEGLHDLWRLRLNMISPTISIGLSKSVPAEHDYITITNYKANADNASMTITYPDRSTKVFTLNDKGELHWKVPRYGKYIIKCNGEERVVYATTKPLTFHFWSLYTLPRYVTHFIGFDYGGTLIDHYLKHGARMSAYASKIDEGATPADKVAAKWKNAYDQENVTGITIDEIYVGKDHLEGHRLSEALLLVKNEKGKKFESIPYLTGIEDFTGETSWLLRKSDPMALNENYWGGEKLSIARWNQIKRANFDAYGSLLSMAPGFVMNRDQHNVIYGPLTPESLRKEFASYRRIAPEMTGVSFFNGYFAHDLEALLDKNIEDFFFKPVIHIHPEKGRLVFKNIGNSDVPPGVLVKFLDSEQKVIKNKKLPIIRPDGAISLKTPQKTVTVEYTTDGQVTSLYPNNTYTLPANMNLLQVESTSIKEGDTISRDPSEPFRVEIKFDQSIIASFSNNSALLLSRTGVQIIPDNITINKARNKAELTFTDVREGDYGLRIKSTPNGFKTGEGALLDGTGDGLLQSGEGLSDDYTVYFTIL